MAINNFLEPSKLSKVETRYVTQFNKVDALEAKLKTLEDALSNLSATYLAIGGGEVTGDVTTTNTEFGDTSFITKTYVDDLLGSYVAKEDYDTLVASYNDLAERLNEFLENTAKSKSEVIGNTVLVTKPNTTSVELKLKQYIDNAFTIDWGDGNTENTAGKNVGSGWNSGFTLTHNYETASTYTITIDGTLGENENYIGDAMSIDDTQFNYIQLYRLTTGISDNDTVTTFKVNNTSIEGGSGSPILSNSSVSEIVIGELAMNVTRIARGCDNLSKATLQFGEVENDGFYFFENCPNLKEIHVTSTTPFDATYLLDTIPEGLKIYVPDSAVDIYKETATWSKYKSYIEGE